MSVSDNQGFPQISAPIAQQGTLAITAPWYQLFIALWNRTGGGQNAVAQGTFPGEVKAFAGPVANVPSGWLPCLGQVVSRKTYSALYAAIGDTWGNGDGSNTFQLPDSKDNFLIGAGGALSVGDMGGASQVTLTVGNLPAHKHDVDDPGHTHTVTDPGHHHTDGTPNATADVAAGAAKTSAIAGTTGNSTTGITIASATTGITTENTGSGDAISIRPPYAAMNFIIKA